MPTLLCLRVLVVVIALAPMLRAHAGAPPTLGERIVAAIPEERRKELLHAAITPRDYRPPAAATSGQAATAPDLKAPATTAKGEPIELEVAGFGLRVPRSVVGLQYRAPMASAPFEVSVKGPHEVRWVVGKDGRMRAERTAGVEPLGAAIPLSMSGSVIKGNSPIPGIPGTVDLLKPILIAADATHVSIEYARPPAEIALSLTVRLPDWQLWITMGQPSPFAHGYIEKFKADLAMSAEVRSEGSDDLRRYVFEPLAKTGASEKQISEACTEARASLLALSDEELLLQVISASAETLGKQTTLVEAAKAFMLLHLTYGVLSEASDVDRIVVNGQTVYVYGNGRSDYIVAYGKDHTIAWRGMIGCRKAGAQIKPLEMTPLKDILPELFGMLDTPKHKNVDPYAVEHPSGGKETR